jgi:hypothetical protein
MKNLVEGSGVVTAASAALLRRLPLRWYHAIAPRLGRWFPLDHGEAYIHAAKRALDPRGERGWRRLGSAGRARLERIAVFLGASDSDADALIDAAVALDWPEPHTVADPPLASPMSWEDRYAMYLVTCLVRPRVAVETGVAYGASSAGILSALDQHGAGVLHSVDPVEHPSLGVLVQASLRARWTVHRGGSSETLPGLLDRVGPIDLFLADSLHSYSHMCREFELAWPHLAPGGVLCAHDVLANNAFERFVARHGPDIDGWMTSVNLGLVRRRGQERRSP